MVTTPTVIVLGAGSNIESGFCTSKRLEADIANEFDTFLRTLVSKEPDIFSSPVVAQRFVKDAEELRDLINSGIHDSIDIILGSRYTKLETIGKIAIAYALLKRETKKIPNTSQKLYLTIFKAMTDSVANYNDLANLSANRVTFVSFNYDRSLEYFFYDCFKKLVDCPAGFNENEFSHFQNFFKCFHVYGSFGQIFSLYHDNFLPYESALSFDNLSAAADRIRVIHNKDVIPDILSIVQALANAKLVIFIGFSFNSKNLVNMSFPKCLKSKPKIYCVAPSFETASRISFLESARDFVGSHNDGGLVEPGIIYLEKTAAEFATEDLPDILS